MSADPRAAAWSQGGQWPKPAGLIGPVLECSRLGREDQIGVCRAGREHHIGCLELSSYGEAAPTDPSGPDEPNYTQAQLLWSLLSWGPRTLQLINGFSVDPSFSLEVSKGR